MTVLLVCQECGEPIATPPVHKPWLCGDCYKGQA